MKPEQVLMVVLREMQAVGLGWRRDWSDFDGRTLQSQLDYIHGWATRALAGETDEEYTEESDYLKDRWGE